MDPILVVAFVSVIPFLIAIKIVRRKISKANENFTLWVIMPFCGAILCLIAVLSMTTFFPVERILISRDGRIISRSGDFWRWDSRLDKYLLVDSTLQNMQATMAVRPITANPKIRDFSYEVKVSCGTPEKTAAFYKNSHGLKPDQWLESQLFEFQEQHSKELAKFYNPVLEEQQDRFRHLLIRFLGPRLDTVKGRFNGTAFQISGSSVVAYQ